MARKVRLVIIAAIFIASAASVTYGQPVFITRDTTVDPAESNLFLAVIVGLILAVAFEMILTHLSVAAGISMVGPLDEPGEKDRGGDEGEQIYMRTAHKFSHAFGVWSLITATISLFAASWFAVQLAGTQDAFYGLVLGLAIWGLFYLLMSVLETATVSSLIGSLTRTAVSGLQSVYQATASVLSKSPEDRIADSAKDITASIKQELFGDMDAGDMRHKIEEYIQQIKPMDARQMKKELAELLDDVELRIIAEHEGGPLADVNEITARLETSGKMSKEKARSMAQGFSHAVDMVGEEYRSGKRPADKASDAAMKAAGLSDQQIKATHEKIERYLRETRREELDPEHIKADIEKLFKSPGEGIEALKDRLSHIDRSTIASVITSRTDISGNKADKIADTVWQQIERLRGVPEEAKAGAADKKAGLQDKMDAEVEGVKAKLQHYMDSLGQPELRYEGVKHDVQLLFHDPKAGADALLQRLKAMDRDTLKAVIASRHDISEEDAEQIVSRMEEARDDTITKAEQMKNQIQEKVQHARERVLHEAEEARQTASAAAWWTFGSALVSAAAAVVGGMLAVEYF
ncbi:MAG: hypothetical protein IH624_20030 [Phycisphaerae bacterium]|nr:hypothetical protein [Phycisphaerae bacterium]